MKFFFNNNKFFFAYYTKFINLFLLLKIFIIVYLINIKFNCLIAKSIDNNYSLSLYH